MQPFLEELFKEINETPANLLPEILDFVRFVNQRHHQVSKVISEDTNQEARSQSVEERLPG